MTLSHMHGNMGTLRCIHLYMRSQKRIFPYIRRLQGGLHTLHVTMQTWTVQVWGQVEGGRTPQQHACFAGQLGRAPHRRPRACCCRSPHHWAAAAPSGSRPGAPRRRPVAQAPPAHLSAKTSVQRSLRAQDVVSERLAGSPHAARTAGSARSSAPGRAGRHSPRAAAAPPAAAAGSAHPLRPPAPSRPTSAALEAQQPGHTACR